MKKSFGRYAAERITFGAVLGMILSYILLKLKKSDSDTMKRGMTGCIVAEIVSLPVNLWVAKVEYDSIYPNVIDINDDIDEYDFMEV